MKKLNATVYNKLLLQAEEAKHQHLTKLASGVLGAIGAFPEEEAAHYNLEELQSDVYDGLWKLAACVVKYHDVNSVDIERVDQVLEALADKLIDQVEISLRVSNEQIGSLEEKVPGQE